MRKGIAAQVVAKALRCRRSKACRAKTRQTSKKHEDHHFDAVCADDGKTLLDRGGVNAVVDDGGHDLGKRKVNENLCDHEKRRKDGDKPIRL